MRKNVFSKKEFVDAASKKFILVELDFPKGDKDLAKKNEPLAEKYKIEGFPTVVLLTPRARSSPASSPRDYPTSKLSSSTSTRLWRKRISIEISRVLLRFSHPVPLHPGRGFPWTHPGFQADQ